MIYFIICILLVYSMQKEKIFQQMPAHLINENCGQDLPYYSVSNVWLSDSNYSQILQDSQSLLVIATHKGCKSCCKHEKLFSLLENFTIGRVEIQQSEEFLQKYNMIKRFPFVLLFNKNQPQPLIYNDILDYDHLNQFLSVSTLLNIESYDSLLHLEQSFLDSTEYSENLEVVKIIGLFYDQYELDEEIKKFYQVADKIKQRNYRAQFAILTNKKELKKAKKKYGYQWFSDYSISSIIIQKHKSGQFQIIDISDIVKGMQDLENVVQNYALPLIDEFVLTNYPFYEQNKKPILAIVLDSIVETQKSIQYLKLIETHIAKRFDTVQVTWMEGSLNLEKTNMLGLSDWVPSKPGLAFFRIDKDVKIVFPKSWDVYNMVQVTEFVDDYLNKPFEYVKEKYWQRKESLLDRKKLWDSLKSISLVDEQNYKKIFLLKTYTLVFPIGDQSSMLQSKNILRIQERIGAFNQNGVIQMCILDVGTSQYIKWLQNTNAHNISSILVTRIKDNKYLIKSLSILEGKSISKILSFIQQETQNSVRFPEDADIQEDELLNEYLQIYDQSKR